MDANGQVLAIADGGLEQGAVELSWAIPVGRLAQLQASQENTRVDASIADALFSAELVDEQALRDFGVDVAVSVPQTDAPPIVVAPNQTCGQSTFAKVRSRSLDELRSAADDPAGLQQLIMASGQMVSGQDQFDVYQDVATGATIVVPGAARLLSQNTGCVVQAAGGRVSQYFRVTPAANPMEVQAQSLQFEQAVVGAVGGGFLNVDFNWTQINPWTRPDGGVVRRGAYYLTQVNNVKYIFETLASKNQHFLGVATVRHIYNPVRLGQQQQCFLGIQSPQCAEIREDLRAQVLMTIATHLSMYPIG